MSLLVVTSPRSSPGATSLCVGLAAAWKEADFAPLLIEADPAGGVLAHRFGLTGHRAQRNLLTFAADTRRQFSGQALANNLNEILTFEALAGPVDPQRAHQSIERASSTIVEHLAVSSRPVVVDVGRLVSPTPAKSLIGAAELGLIVIEPQVDQVQAALFQARFFRELSVPVELVLIGDQPIEPAEVARLLDLNVAAVLPSDAATAVALKGGRFKQSSFRRSPLWRSLSGLALRLLPLLVRDEPVHIDEVDEAVPAERAAAEAPASAELPPPPAVVEAAPPPPASETPAAPAVVEPPPPPPASETPAAPSPPAPAEVGSASPANGETELEVVEGDGGFMFWNHDDDAAAQR